MKRILIISAIISLLACNDEKHTKVPQEDKTVQDVVFLQNNNPKISIIQDYEVPVNLETCVNITLGRSGYKLESAFIECSEYSMKGIDVVGKTIMGCGERLYIENDTIQICFKPTKKRLYSHNVAILLSDLTGNFYVYDTSFALTAH
jgi:hypothetical protein